MISADRYQVAGDPEEQPFYSLADDDLTTLTTAAPLRVPRKGKADIGGRARATAILRRAGVASDLPDRIAGSTNEVWKAGDYVVRVGFVPGADRLRREAKMAAVLPSEVQYPKVIASGVENFGEWIVVKHRQGRMLSEMWSEFDFDARRALTHEVARATKAVHQVVLTADQREELAFHEGEGSLALPHQLPAQRILEMLDRAQDLSYMDAGLIEALMEKTKEVADAVFAHERHGLVHGDLHFENMLVKDGVLVAMLDFEWCRPGPREIDIDMLARFCAHPELSVTGSYSVHADDYKYVLSWMNEAYPGLFEDEFLIERLTLCALSFEVPWLLKLPPSAPAAHLPEFHPINRLRQLLDHGTDAERIGWGQVDQVSDPFALNPHF